MLDLESGDSGAKLKPKGSTKEPTSGPTPGGNVIKIETREGSMNSDTITYFFSGSEEMPLITVEETKLDGPCTHSTGLTVTIQEPGMEELSCHQHHSRVEKKGPPGYDESEQVTGEPRAVKAKLQEIATVLEKSDAWTRDVVRDAVLAVLAAVLARLGSGVGADEGGERPGAAFASKEAETYMLESLDDAPTEVMDVGAIGSMGSEDILEDTFPTAAQWQYGRCVALKLVAHSPYGSSAYEQLLSVLLTVFKVTPDERTGSFSSRKASQSSWWRASLLRCSQNRGPDIPEDDALLP
eukprot:g24530.t1